LKGQDAHLQFVFMTGVTKFSKVSLFSGINQIMDITINESFATICGYTPIDLQSHFADHLADVDMKKLEQWYNGYRWLGKTSVYNPFDIRIPDHRRYVHPPRPGDVPPYGSEPGGQDRPERSFHQRIHPLDQ
ncbi:MAG: AAA family ATPase, partial [Desulfotignum sp.]